MSRSAALTYLQGLLDTMVFNKLASDSGVERSSWNRLAIQNFEDTFGFGRPVRLLLRRTGPAACGVSGPRQAPWRTPHHRPPAHYWAVGTASADRRAGDRQASPGSTIGLSRPAPDGSTKTAPARPCSPAAGQTDGTTTCFGIPLRYYYLAKSRSVGFVLSGRPQGTVRSSSGGALPDLSQAGGTAAVLIPLYVELRRREYP
jgi:hypothetical protein